MKKVLLTMAMVLCLTGLVRADGVTIWGLTEDSVAANSTAFTGRVGYQYEFIEGFLGSTWRPQYDGEGQIDPPQIFSLGALVHTHDVIDPNSSIPWLPAFLLTFLNEDMVAQPYFGYQGTFNIDSDAGFTGAIVGILTKTKPDSKAAMVFELDYNNNFLDLGAVPDNEWTLNIGFRFGF